MSQPLALPWPSWHTDSEIASRHLREMPDRDLLAAEEQHRDFFNAHCDSPWLYDIFALTAVDRCFDRIMARRFREIMSKRSSGSRAAARIRSIRVLPKAA